MISSLSFFIRHSLLLTKLFADSTITFTVAKKRLYFYGGRLLSIAFGSGWSKVRLCLYLSMDIFLRRIRGRIKK